MQPSIKQRWHFLKSIYDMRESSLLYIWNYFHQTTHHQKKSYKTKEINSFSIFSKKENKHSFAKLTINNRKIQCKNVWRWMLPGLNKMHWQQGGEVIVCGSHKNPLSRLVFLSHQLQKIICFIVKQERETGRGERGSERDSQRDGVRGLCFPRCCCDAPWTNRACPTAHLGGCAVGQKAKKKTLSVWHITS